MGGPATAGLEAWHKTLRDMRDETLDEILAEDVVFHSPVVHTPQEGRAITKLYLLAAYNVFPGDEKKDEAGASDPERKGSFQYVRQVVGEHDAVLEFTTEVDGIFVNGVDMIRWNDDGRIVDFKVMVRPKKAMEKLHGQMAAMLESMKSGG